MTSKARSNAKPAAPRTAPAAAAANSAGQRRPVAIVGGNRIPFARSDKAYAQASNQDMFTATLDGLVSRFNLQGEKLGMVVGGAVLKHSRDFNLIRESVLGSALSPYTSAYDLQQACGTGLQSIIAVGDAISAGRIDSGIGGGTDTTSDAPIGVNDQAREFLLSLNRAKSTGDRIKLLGNVRAGMLGLEIPRNGEPRTGKSMGDHAAITAKEFGIKREDQDELAAASHKNMAAAYDRGFFDDLVTPFLGLTRDDNLRPGSTVEKLSTLKPVFGTKLGDATMTAGNSTPLTDGASAVLLSTDEWAAERNLPVLAHLVDSETAAVDYVHGKDGLLMAPTYAIPRLLARNGLTLQDFDYYEIHEAFASVVLATLQGLRVGRVLQGTPRPRRRIGIDRPKQAQCQRIVLGCRSPVRGDRRTYCGFPRKDARGEGFGPRPDLDLCGRWPGCHGDHRAVTAPQSPRATENCAHLQ